ERFPQADLRGMTDERGGDLGVDQPYGEHVRVLADDLEVLTAAVQHPRRAGPRERGEERRKIEVREAVDAGRHAVRRDLHEAELRVIGSLSNELRIERHELRPPELGDELAQCRVAVDQTVHGAALRVFGTSVIRLLSRPGSPEALSWTGRRTRTMFRTHRRR